MKNGQGQYSPPTAGSSKPLPPLPAPETCESTQKRSSNQYISTKRGRPVKLPRITTADTDVTQSVSPAITREIVLPKQHENVEKRITRDIHTHDIYHHILPITQTEILPPKHFLESPDGCSVVEIPTNELDNYTLTKTGGDRQRNTANPTECTVSRNGKSRILSGEKSPRCAPILADKKAYMTKEGITRTKYLWRHPPVFEDAIGRTVPVLIPAGVTPEWKGLLDRENKDKARHSKDRAADHLVHTKVPSPLRTNTRIGHSQHDTYRNVALMTNPSIPVKVSPRDQAEEATPESHAFSGYTSGHSSKIRGGRHGLAKKDSHSNLKRLVGTASSSEEDLLRNDNTRHSRGSEGTGGCTASRTPDIFDPNSQLRRELEERAKRK